MPTQNFSNHVKKHALFHYFLVPVSLLLIPAAVANLVLSVNLAGFIILLLTILLHIAIFLTRDYAKKNQDRIIRMEMRFRYYLLTGKSPDQVEALLSKDQMAALRFASDDELLRLLNDARTAEASATEIKRQIKNWLPDHMRV